MTESLLALHLMLLSHARWVCIVCTAGALARIGRKQERGISVHAGDITFELQMLGCVCCCTYHLLKCMRARLFMHAAWCFSGVCDVWVFMHGMACRQAFATQQRLLEKQQQQKQQQQWQQAQWEAQGAAAAVAARAQMSNAQAAVIRIAPPKGAHPVGPQPANPGAAQDFWQAAWLLCAGAPCSVVGPCAHWQGFWHLLMAVLLWP